MNEAKKIDLGLEHLASEQVETAPVLLEILTVVNGPHLRSRIAFWMTKRLFDISFSLVALLLLSPFIALLAIAIKIDSPGPVLFSQIRVGRHLRLFTILKFRTMYTGVPDEPRPIWDAATRTYRRPHVTEDPRITRMGRILRRWSIDELPQLVNVLIGDMALIGPRPLSVQESVLIPRSALTRYAVPAGITGLAQVTCREMMMSPERFAMDLKYVDDMSIKQEIHVFLRTFSEVVRFARAAKARLP